MTDETSIEKRIIDTARHMMFSNGIRSTSMDDIASNMAISKKTIYQYFSDKDALVEKLMVAVITENQCSCEGDKCIAENAIHEAFLNIEAMSKMFKKIHNAIMYDLEKYHPKVYSILAQHRDEYVFNIIKGNILRGQKEKLYRKEISVDLIARYRVESIFLFFTNSFRKHIEISFAETEREIMTNFIYGLVTPKGYETIARYTNK